MIQKMKKTANLFQSSIHLPNELPFSYRVRESKRAQQAQLRITRRYGLEVIVPKHLVGRYDVLPLLHEKRDWIEKHLSLSAEPVVEEPVLPNQLLLSGIEETWSVAYIAHRRFELLENAMRELTLLGDVANTARCRDQLIRWLKTKAKAHFNDLLSCLSQEVGLPFRCLHIRGQQTRWGSCSGEGDISLNYQLLFLPQVLVKHIMLHELVHTRYLHHGKSFWQLLSQLDAHTKHHAHQARRANHYVPKWVVACV